MRFNFKSSIAPVALLLVIANFALAQTAGNNNNLNSQAAQVTEFDVNGLKVLLKRRTGSPTVAASIFVRGGTRNITEKDAGIEDLTLKSAIEAGKKYNRQTVRREISRTGSGLAASAGDDFSIVSFGTTRPNFDRIWDIFTDTLIDPVFAAEDIERNRQATLTGLREFGVSPEGALENEIQRVIYAGHPYANDVNGTTATVAGFKTADIIAYHKKIMVTSRLLLVVVGDLEPAELKAKVAASFGKLPRGDYKEQPYPPLNFSKPTVDVIARPNLPTNYVKGVFDAPSLDNPDYYAMRVAMSILQQLIFQEVRTNRQLSYAPGAELEKYGANTANITVSSVDPNQSVQVMLEQINLMKTLRLNDDIVAEIAGNFLTTYYLSQETSGAQVGELARYELIGGGWRNAFEFLNKISSVKSDDLNMVANKYMKNIRFVVVGDPKVIDTTKFILK